MKSKQMFRNIKKGIEEKTEDISMTTNTSMVCPHLDICVQFWSFRLKKYVLGGEKVHIIATRMIQRYGTASV